MTAVLVSMTVVLVVAVLALVYAAFPHRGEPVPGAPWIGDVLGRAADAVPTVTDGDLDADLDADRTSTTGHEARSDRLIG